ncbi:MAG: sn-glycerol-3-phosphate ABC transporter substrate-binding protein UgpB [Alphaproteobacteria bacterium]|nr:sn-glycerol-3-phosphate ABC transporter substrate-binding protein UgpB [Alphaproteobacteria bacterium]
MISRRTLIAGTAAAAGVVAAPWVARAQAQRVQVNFWHGLGQPLGGILEQVVAGFNGSQTQFQVNATFRGAYPETMQAAIAAFRAGNAPHIVQMFEVGTATMMAARTAIMPVHQLSTDTGVAIDPAAYLPGVRGYYSTSDGKLMSMPFNSSTTILYYNKEAFRKAGLNPDQAPATWAAVREATQRIKATNAAPIPYATGWPTWVHHENFSAIHNVPLATKANGMDGMDAELRINSPLHVRHTQMLVDMQREGLFRYGGRDGAGEAVFATGEAAIMTTSSGFRARALREVPGGAANVGFGYLPYHNDAIQSPLNSIIGGASLWVMQSPNRTRDEYRAVAEFFKYISQPQIDSKWSQDTGYVPITLAGAAQLRESGFWAQNPGSEIPTLQLQRGTATENSRGLRLGNMPQIRVVIQEELERALQGQQSAEQACNSTVTRGNEVLRAFERANR